ncbi:hypothetical protein MGN70_000694 [Eutypa lata]|nr:hypothetical protein MGN70_000694 [Eutypa lata]
MDILQKVTWSTAEQTLKYKVYLGLWTNWSRGSVLGKTLTLSRQQAALTALLCVAAFTLAGGFSSQISSSVGNEVLLDGVNCGTLVSNGSSLPVEMASYFAQLVNNAQNYVQQCYSTGSSGLIDCKAFVTERIPLFINDTAQCPFQTRVCRSNTSNLILDTGYLSSHDHFGVNAPPDDRTFMRRVLHCGALTTTGFTHQYEEQNRNYTLYDYGTSFKASGKLTFTNQAKSIESQYIFGRGEATNFDYLLQEYASWVFNGGYKHPATFIPIKELQRTDADTTLLFLSGNGVLFTEPVEDDW